MSRLALGFLVTLYATLITLFGLAWVLFLIGMIPFPWSIIMQPYTNLIYQAGSMLLASSLILSTLSTTF